jgi:hypothetical protein
VKAIGKDAIVVVTKAVEFFVGYLARKCAYTVSLRGLRSIRQGDVLQTIYMQDSLEFLRMDFPRSLPLAKSIPAQIVNKSKSKKNDNVGEHSGRSLKDGAPASSGSNSITGYFLPSSAANSI